MKFSVIVLVLALVLSFVLINAGARGTYRSAWAAITAPARATPRG